MAGLTEPRGVDLLLEHPAMDPAGDWSRCRWQRYPEAPATPPAGMDRWISLTVRVLGYAQNMTFFCANLLISGLVSCFFFVTEKLLIQWNRLKSPRFLAEFLCDLSAEPVVNLFCQHSSLKPYPDDSLFEVMTWYLWWACDVYDWSCLSNLFFLLPHSEAKLSGDYQAIFSICEPPAGEKPMIWEDCQW